MLESFNITSLKTFDKNFLIEIIILLQLKKFDRENLNKYTKVATLKKCTYKDSVFWINNVYNDKKVIKNSWFNFNFIS